MKNQSYLFLFLFVFILNLNLKSQEISMNIQCTINPVDHQLKATVKITLPEELKSPNGIDFKLHKDLRITYQSAKTQLQKLETADQYHKTYTLFPGKIGQGQALTLKYEGKIYEKPDAGPAEYARGFSQTRGIISEEGVYLSGSSLWLPDFGDALITFDLKVELPEKWLLISQGKTESEKDNHYVCTSPQEEVYLIAAPFYFFEIGYQGKNLQAYLRSDDMQLANKYLKATSRYMGMYEQMLGDYPYSKFALVENFWETGYGMPSFTLLGPKVIRFPFILYSSYPHELLHNYWGNSVYVDYTSGNWCEGITAYMADHMLKEQQRQGAEYRRATLQKFSDFVHEDNDFPLNKFISRNNPAEEAIGYGKCLMMNHMLRLKVGDNRFLEAYRNFYTTHKYKRASFTDIQKSFERYLPGEAEKFFNQWVNRTGAPKLSLVKAELSEVKRKSIVQFVLEQQQEEEAFQLDVPVAFYFQDTVIKQVYTMTKKVDTFNYSSKNTPIRMEIDPEYDVFRTLDRKEVPPSLSQVMGSKHLWIILPSESEKLEAWQSMANMWKESGDTQDQMIEVMMDTEVKELPLDQSLWILGKNNKWAEFFEEYKTEAFAQGDAELLRACSDTGSLVLTYIPDKNPELTYGFITAHQAEAIPGLTRLLPHYGKYSVLGFFGTRPSNQAKLILKPKNSPLHYVFNPRLSTEITLKPAPALVEVKERRKH